MFSSKIEALFFCIECEQPLFLKGQGPSFALFATVAPGGDEP